MLSSPSSSEALVSVGVGSFSASVDEGESVTIEDDESVVREGSLEELEVELVELLELLEVEVLVGVDEAVELVEEEKVLEDDVVGLAEDEEDGLLLSELPPPFLLNTTTLALAPLGTETTQKFAPPAPGPFI